MIMNADNAEVSVGKDGSQKWYNLMECNDKEVSSLSDTNHSDVTNYPTSYETDLLGTAADQDEIKNWYALSIADAEDSSNLSSSISESKRNDNTSVSLSPWLYPIVSQGSTFVSSEQTSTLGTISDLSNRLQSGEISLVDNKSKNHSIADSAVQGLNSSSIIKRPEPVGQSFADALIIPSILPSTSQMNISNISTVSSSHSSKGDRSSIISSIENSIEDESKSDNVATLNKNSIILDITEELDVPSKSIPPSTISSIKPLFVNDISQSDSSINNLLGSNYISAEKILDRFRQERFQIPSVSDIQHQQFDSTRDDDLESHPADDPKIHSDDDLESQPIATYSPCSSMTSGPDYSSTHHSEIYSIIHSVDPENDNNESHSEENHPQLINEFIDSPDLGIASTVTGFSVSPRNGRSMHCGVSTQSSDSARGYQSLVTDNIDQELRLDNFDHHIRNHSPLSQCSISTTDSFSSELIRLQQSDDSLRVSLPIGNPVSGSNDIETQPSDFIASNHNSNNPVDLTPDDIIREIHRSLGAGTITPLFPELDRPSRSQSAPSTLDVMDSTPKTKETDPEDDRDIYPREIYDKLSSSSQTSTSSHNDLASISITQTYDNSSIVSPVKNNSTTSTDTSSHKPRVSPVLPSKHNVGIYDINYSSGPGSTNRRRLYHGLQPIGTNNYHIDRSSEIYVSHGSEESNDLGVNGIPQLSSTLQHKRNLPLASYPQPNRSSFYQSDDSGSRSNLTDDTEMLLKYPSMIAEKLDSYKKSRSNDELKTKFGIANNASPNSSFIDSSYNRPASETETKDVNRLWERFLIISDDHKKAAQQKNDFHKHSNPAVKTDTLDIAASIENPSYVNRDIYLKSTKIIPSCQRCNRKDVSTNCPTPTSEHRNTDSQKDITEPLMLHAWTQTNNYVVKNTSPPYTAPVVTSAFQPYSSLYNYRLPPSSPIKRIKSYEETTVQLLQRNMSDERADKPIPNNQIGSNSIHLSNDRLLNKHNINENRRTNVHQTLTLQEAFLTSCHEFIYRSRQRQFELKEKALCKTKISKNIILTKTGKSDQQLTDDVRLPQRVTSQDSRWDYHHKPTKRQVNMKQSIANNKKKYNALPEVINKHQQLVKDSRFRTNRLRVKAFDHKLRKQLLEKRQR